MRTDRKNGVNKNGEENNNKNMEYEEYKEGKKVTKK